MLVTRVPDATTVILARDGHRGPELFMVRRSGGADFFGDASVFPGGRVEDGDGSPELLARCAPMGERESERLEAENLSSQARLTCWVGALRELFEEIGILLAYREGRPLDFRDPQIRERFRAHRAALAEKRVTFAQIVADEGLVLATDRLFYFSRYVTPSYSPKRYDTRFVIAAAPPDQLPAHDDFELVSGEWLTATEAIGMYHSGERQIVPPTLQNLFQIAEAPTVDALIAQTRRQVITPMCPTSVRIAGAYTLIYPGDRDYMPVLEPGFTSLDKRPEAMPVLRFAMDRHGRWGVTPGVPRGGSMTTVEERLHRLEAIAEIKQLTSRYCWHVARGEGEAIVDLFTTDGVLDGSTTGMGVVRGRDELTAFYRRSVNTAEAALPFIQNHIIDVAGDEATGSCALEARFTTGGRSVTAAGYYLDTYRRVDGRWLFAERKLFFHHAVPLSVGWAESRG